MEHAKLSPSTAHRWMNCGGSLRLIDSMGDKGITMATPAMLEGTAAHELARRKLLKHNYKRFPGRGIITPESEKAVDKYIEIVLDLKGDSDMFVEKTVHYTDVVWGTSDVILTDYETLDVLDYKNGRIGVHVENNPQLMIYAAAALRELDDLETIEKVNIHIVQPQGLGVPEWQTQRLTVREVLAWSDAVLEEALTAVDIGNLNAGPHCEYCPAQSVCEAFPAYALKLARKDFSVHDLSEILSMTPAIISWLDQTQEAALDELKAGREVTGYKLVNARTHRKWSTDDSAKFAKKLRGIKKDRWTNTITSILTPSQMEKSEPKLYVKLKALLKRQKGDLQVARFDDSRPEVEMKD